MQEGGRRTHIAPTDGKVGWEEEEDGCDDDIGDTQLLRCVSSWCGTCFGWRIPDEPDYRTSPMAPEG